MANDAAALDVHVSSRGAISDAQRDQARDKIARLVRLCREPVLVAQVRLVVENGPGAIALPRSRPCRHRRNTLDHMARHRHRGDRSRRRPLRRRSRDSKPVASHADECGLHGSAAPRRGARDGQKYSPIHRRARLVRRKSFALERCRSTKRFDLDALAHDSIFSRQTTMRDCVLSYDADGLELLHPDDVKPDVSAVAVPVRLRAVAAVELTEAEARERLDVGHERFVFFLSSTNRGNVMYLRRDGHYGLIEAG